MSIPPAINGSILKKDVFLHLSPYGFPQSTEAVFLTATAGLNLPIWFHQLDNEGLEANSRSMIIFPLSSSPFRGQR